MIALIVGISAGILVILLFTLLKKFDKPLVYGLILTGIGFIYIGFTWTDLTSLIITCVQALVFLAIAYFGTRKSLSFLGLGYVLHGCWDIVYGFFDNPGLIPPDYDIFCLSIDLVMGIYLFILARKIKVSL
jgi:hypothetical protein